MGGFKGREPKRAADGLGQQKLCLSMAKRYKDCQGKILLAGFWLRSQEFEDSPPSSHCWGGGGSQLIPSFEVGFFFFSFLNIHQELNSY
jgi:hypothetical protein